MRMTVEVQVNLMRAVTMEIEVEDGDEPTDLTDEEREKAIDLAQSYGAEDCGAEIVGVVVR